MMSLWMLWAACGPSEDAILTGLQSNNPAVREDMVKIARNANSDAVIEALVSTLEDPSPKIRYEAIESLVNLEAEAAIPALILRLNDMDPDVQNAAIDALGQLETPEGSPALVDLLEQRLQQNLKGVAEIPLNAIWALGAIGDNSALGVLSKLREHADPYVVYNANWALRELRADEAPSTPSEPAPEPEEPASQEG